MHRKKVAQLAFRSMHFAIELAEFYISYNGRILTWYTSLVGWVLHGLFLGTFCYYHANHLRFEWTSLEFAWNILD